MSNIVIKNNILNDVNGTSLLEFTDDVSQKAMMITPCNTEEVLILGNHVGMPNVNAAGIYVYNRVANTLRQNKVSLYCKNFYKNVASYAVAGNTVI